MGSMKACSEQAASALVPQLCIVRGDAGVAVMYCYRCRCVAAYMLPFHLAWVDRRRLLLPCLHAMGFHGATSQFLDPFMREARLMQALGAQRPRMYDACGLAADSCIAAPSFACRSDTTTTQGCWRACT